MHACGQLASALRQKSEVYSARKALRTTQALTGLRPAKGDGAGPLSERPVPAVSELGLAWPVCKGNFRNTMYCFGRFYESLIFPKIRMVLTIFLREKN